MYTVLKNVQIIVSLLKKFGVKHIVLSPGTRNIPLVCSVENDSFFKCYSITDERSAAFFGIGLIQELNEPVAICCTSGTATCNYISGVTEAFYQKLPLVVITADRDEYCLNQLEDQTVPQMSYFKDITKKSVNVPIIQSKRDYDYSVRIVNDALLEMNHHGYGPVHINMQVAIGPEETDFSVQELPDVRKISRHMVSDRVDMQAMAKKLSNAKRIFVIYGQHSRINEQQTKSIERFFDHFDCVIGTELMSNLKCKGCVDIDNAPHFWSSNFQQDCLPEIVISVNGNFLSDYKGALKGAWSFEHWLVNEDGALADPYKKLTDIFEGDVFDFFDTMSDLSPSKRKNYDYFTSWKNHIDSIPVPNCEYSDLYAMKQLMGNLPENSVLHMANSNSVRLAQMFSANEGVKVYCNRGTNGIDGSMSSFIGTSAVTENLCFLVIGDLSFFYDMNALWNRYVKKNIRIMLSNNSGAGIFHYTRGLSEFPNLDVHIAAEHNAIAKGWVESRGFLYLSAHNKEELDEVMKKFVSVESNKPIFLEVFTDKEENKNALQQYYNSNHVVDTSLKGRLKKVAKKILG